MCTGVTVTAGLISYPIDTIRRRMMMTSGQAVKYNGAIDCTRQILANEGFMSMMKGNLFKLVNYFSDTCVSPFLL